VGAKGGVRQVRLARMAGEVGKRNDVG
jgi:hypothetical protein